MLLIQPLIYSWAFIRVQKHLKFYQYAIWLDLFIVTTSGFGIFFFMYDLTRLQAYWRISCKCFGLTSLDILKHMLDRLQHPNVRTRVIGFIVLSLCACIIRRDTISSVQMISAEAPVLFAKAAQIFITELTLRAWIHTEDNKRRTLQVSYTLKLCDFIFLVLGFYPHPSYVPCVLSWLSHFDWINQMSCQLLLFLLMLLFIITIGSSLK